MIKVINFKISVSTLIKKTKKSVGLQNYSENEVPPSTLTKNNSNPRLNEAEKGLLINLVVIKKRRF